MIANHARMTALRISLFVAICLVASSSAHADVLFDNYNGSFLTSASINWGCLVNGPDVGCGSPHEQAIRFTVASGGLYDGFYLNSITVPLSLIDTWDCLPDPDTTLWVGVYTDVADLRPGTPLETVQVVAPGTDPVEVTASFVGTTVLEDGTTYWVVLVGNYNSNHFWSYPDPRVDTGNRMYRYGDGYLWKSGEDDPAVRIEGIPTGPGPVRTSTWGQIKTLFR